MSTEENKALKQLRSKKVRLEAIISSQYPSNTDLIDAHNRRVENAKSLLAELNDVIALASDYDNDTPIFVVPKSTFDKVETSADFVTEEYDGVFCRVCNICNFLCKPHLIIYVASFATL